MKAVDVLGRVDAIHDGVGVEAHGQRQLHQYAVDGRIGVQLADQGEQIGLADVTRRIEGHRADAGFLAGLALVAHIDRRGRIGAHQHDCESGRPAAFAFERLHADLDLGPHPRRHGLAVEHHRCAQRGHA